MAHLTLITGGVRSGKSMFAERLAAAHEQVAYIATCQSFDDEMSERIKAHQTRRPSHWELVEEPLNLASAVEKVDGNSFIIIECLGLWVTNWLLQNEEMSEYELSRLLEQQAASLLSILRERKGPAIFVSNEAGMGVVPPYRLGRVFRDCLGRLNQVMASHVDDVYLCAAGLPLCLKREGVLLHG